MQNENATIMGALYSVFLLCLFITLFFVNLGLQWSQNNELSDDLLNTFMLTGSLVMDRFRGYPTSSASLTMFPCFQETFVLS